MCLKIPDDIAVVSFDNPEAFQVSKPGISCYQQPMEQICMGTLGLIKAKLDGKESENKTNQFKGELIVRNSS